MKLVLRITAFIALITFSGSKADAQFYTGSDHEFGQNRVQYNPHYWQFYDFERFKIYFVSSGKTHAEYVAKSAHKYLKEIEAFFDFNVSTKIQFVVFNNQSSFRQSNIGLRNGSDGNIGGVTTIDGNKIFVYYEGDHQKMDEQIRKGIAGLVIAKLMYGQDWKEALKNSTLSTFPEWYLKGLEAYMSGDWNVKVDNQVKDAIEAGKFSKFNRLNGDDATLAGRALWNYIAEAYGEKMIPNILYLTRISRNVESGFVYILGTSLKELSREFVAYYKLRFQEDDQSRTAFSEDELHIKTKSIRKYSQFKLSPDGKYAAFVSNEMGQYKVWLYDIQKNEKKALARYDKYLKKKEAFEVKQEERKNKNDNYRIRQYKSYNPKYYRSKRIMKRDHKLDRIPDVSFPVLAWHPSGQVLAIAHEQKGNLLLTTYDFEEKKLNDKMLMNLEKVLHMEYAKNGKQIIFSAAAKGQTDIYLYNIIGNNQKQLTDDIYDDLHPSFIEGDKKIIFASNRDDDTIRKNVDVLQYRYDKDIYVLEIDRPTYPLIRITNSPLVDEDYPNQYSPTHYAFLSSKNGIYNRYQAYYDSAVDYIDTSVHYRYFSVKAAISDYDRSVIEFHNQNNSNNYGLFLLKDGKYTFLKGSKKNDRVFDDPVSLTRHMEYYLRSNNGNALQEIHTDNIVEKDSNAVDIDNYQFGYQKSKNKVVESSREINPDSVKLVRIEDESFVRPREQIYDLNFATDYVVSQIDNSFLNPNYQRISTNGYQNPGLNTVALLGLIDVFEDYRIIGGFRYPVNFSNTEYLISVENLKSRVDKKILGSRQSFDRVVGSSIQKLQTYNVKYSVKYPFSEVASLRMTSDVRWDRSIYLSTEPATLMRENKNDYLGGLKLAYVYDNTRSLGVNLPQGIRLKVWGEVYRNLDIKKTDFFVFGGDVRTYSKLHRTIIFANRFAVSTSVGSQRLVYYMGGVDNWLGAKYDQSIQVAGDQNYQFQTIATPMRGFFQNARNGNSFAVINSELRLPLIKYLSGKPIKSDFLENLMLIGFTDIGTAWTGVNPYDEANSFNTSIVEGKNYIVTIKNQKEPIIYGYGTGIRSRIFSYYVRFDWAWGVDDGVIMPAVKYLSLSLDF